MIRNLKLQKYEMIENLTIGSEATFQDGWMVISGHV